MAKKINIISNQKGASIIAVIAIMLILAVMGAALVSLVTTGSDISVNQLQSEQAFNVAEGGMEFESRSLAENLDWYRSTTNPIQVTATNLGSGSFTVNTYLPATMVRNRIPTPAANSIRVYSATLFPTAGNRYLQIEDDIAASAEFVQYTGIAGDTFTGVARDVTIGGIKGAAGAQAHERGSRVYPVTTLLTALATLGSPCAPAPSASFDITYHPVFLSAGTIDMWIDNAGGGFEEITYTGSSITGATMTLQGVTRCVNLTSSAHAAGDPVTSILVDGASPDFEAEAVSTGTVSGTTGATRVVKKTTQR